MRFYLINFSYTNTYAEKTRNPPVGAGYILQHLQRAGISTRYYEWSFGEDIALLLADIQAFSPDLIGCSLMSYKYQKSYTVIDALAELDLPIVLGGAHINSRGATVLKETKARFLIRGEGEHSLLELLRCLAAGGTDYQRVPGLIYQVDGVLMENPRELLNIESLDFPRYEQFDLASYSMNELLLQSSRGCPYFCTYCQQSALLGKKWRSRTPAQVFGEMEFWASKGFVNFLFADDNMTLDKKRIHELCSLIAKSHYHYEIQTAGVRIDNIDLETLQMMRQSRFNYLSFGIESGSDRVLKEIKKGITLSQVHRTLDMACSLKYQIKLYFIVNNRTETYADVQASFALARQYPIVLARFTNLVPYPQTYDYDWILKNGRLLVDPEDFMNDPDNYLNQPLYDGPGMSLGERYLVLAEAQREIKRYEPGWSDKFCQGLSYLRQGNFQAIGKYFQHKFRKGK